MLLPVDKSKTMMLTKRYSTATRMSLETQEIFKTLLKAHLNVEQAHEYIRERFSKKLQIEGWRI